jgi:hypothetical protein
MSNKDPGGVLKAAFNEVTQNLKVELPSTELTISHLDDSIQTYPQNTLVAVAFDAITVEETSSIIETYKYRTGGAAGSIVATVAVTYTDASKEMISSVVKT